MTTIRAKVPVSLLLDSGERIDAEMVTFHGLTDGREHLAVVFGDPPAEESPLVRLHSECLTGDVFGSARCDCGRQLDEAITVMARRGGIVLYLRQEGRGIGLYNKLDAYRLQDTGLDTYAANRALNFQDDERDYAVAAQMLGALGVAGLRLLSNNPDKAAQLAEHGIEVEEICPTSVFRTDANERYLRAKRDHTGHMLCLPSNTGVSR